MDTAEERQESKPKLSLQRSTRDSELGIRNIGGVPPIVHEVLRSPGQPLDAETRAFIEPRFGHDFSQVRVHTDARAEESAVAVNALAYTVGRDVVFAAGQFAPASTTGKKILAHELTHVVQQRKGVIAPLHSAGASIIRDDAYEREADAQSALVGEGKPAPRGFQQDEIMDPETAPAKVIQLLEKATADPFFVGIDDQGKPCVRYYFPMVSGGQVTWEGISQETLDKHVRLKPEEGDVLFKATANGTDTCDAVYFGPAYRRFILKIPDHCTVTFKSSLSTRSTCCNIFGAGAAELKGKDLVPRTGTAEEFRVPNDWEPAKAPGAEPVKLLKEPEQPSMGTAIPIKG